MRVELSHWQHTQTSPIVELEERKKEETVQVERPRERSVREDRIVGSRTDSEMREETSAVIASSTKTMRIERQKKLGCLVDGF